MRRLPVYFVLDCSESMAGENLKKMEDGLGMIVRSLRADPHALETVHLSVIAFAGVAKTIAPLIEVASFYPPKLPIGSGTNLGAAIDELMTQIDLSVAKTTPDQKGDWKPIVYLFTDGKPTERVDVAISAWHKRYSRKAMLVAVALGKYADLSVLHRLTETVLLLEDSREGDFRKFVRWVSDSVVKQSQSVGEGKGDRSNLAKLDDNVLTLVKKDSAVSDNSADQDCAVFVGRCQKSRQPYLIKYDRMKNVMVLNDRSGLARFELTGCYSLTQEYFDWSSPDKSKITVSTSELTGVPGCPYCGNSTAFAKCGCGKLMCLGKPGKAVCPWCESTVEFSVGGGEEAFDVQRGRG